MDVGAKLPQKTEIQTRSQKIRTQQVPTRTVKISSKAKEHSMKGTAARKLMTSLPDEFEMPETGTEHGDVRSTIENFFNNRKMN